MALVLNDRVKETTTTTGTGTVNLAGAETGFETFVAGIGNTNTTYYAIVHQSAAEFEVGLGTVSDSSPDTLSRTTIISSSNSDSAVNFSAGTKDVFCTLPASKAVFIDGSGDLEFNAPGDDFSFKNSSNTIAFIKTTNNDFIIQNNLNDKDFILKGYDADGGGLITGLTIDYSDAGRATFNGSVDIGGGTITRTGDLTLDVSGDLTLDAGGENIKLHDDGTEIGQIDLGSANVTIRSSVQDKNTIFRGNDGGTEIEAMRIDYAEGGRVGIGTSSPSRPVHIEMAGDATLLDRTGSAGGVLLFANGGTVKGNVGVQSGGFGIGGGFRDPDLFMDTSGNVGLGTTSPASPLHIRVGTDNNLEIEETGGDLRLLAINDARAVNVPMEFAASRFEFLTGSVGINESSPDSKLHVNSGSTNVAAKFESTDSIAAIQFTDSGGSAEIGCSGTSNTFYPNGALKMSLDSSGNLVASGNITAYGSPSDIKLKENIEVIDNALDKVKQLKGITYDLKSDGNRLTGLIAQDLEKVLPEAVYTAKDLEDEEHLAIRYGNTVGLLVEAIKELEARVKELEGK